MNPKICSICKKDFEPKKYNQVYCSRKCYFTSNRARMRAKYVKLKKKGRFPKWICPYCKNVMELDFSPLVSYGKWRNLICPNCGYKRTYALNKQVSLELG